jgi:lipid II:glycine glycyltransferase (peptidoglycan interpeptide bridge formation enzyme)
VVDAEGEAIAAVSFQERPLGRRLPGTLGRRTLLYAPRGPVLLREADERAAGAALASVVGIAASLNAAVVTLDPAWPVDGPLAGALTGAGFAPAAREIQVSRTAMIVPLFEHEDEQHRLVRKSTANLINRARRDGASAERVDLASGNPDEREGALAEMHDLLVATARREGIDLRDRDYQLAQWRALGEAGVASLWFAVVDGRRWAGSVLLRCGRTLMQFQAGSADGADMRRVPANHLLQWEILRWAASNGFGGYDLGGVDAPGARGLPIDERHPLWNLAVFKRGFGAEGVEYVPAHERASSRLFGTLWRLARRLR